MSSNITRRDLLNGAAVTAGALLATPLASPGTLASAISEIAARESNDVEYYPPTLTGMRGSHDGSYEVAHALAWHGEKPDSYRSLDEHYDLVVVGAGISGLAAARFWRMKMGQEARILILDNHDDFGGHAKRNEFHHDGRMLLSLGGAQNLENPGNYSEVASKLMADLGIDGAFLDVMDAQMPEDFALAGKLKADNGIAIPGPEGHRALGGSWTSVTFGVDGYEAAVRSLPIPEVEQEKLIALFGGQRDFLDGLSLREKWRYINSTSYNQFLLERVELAEESLPLTNSAILHFVGLSGWHLSVLEAIEAGAPGIKGLGWVGKSVATIGSWFVDSLLQTRMFPDGNASVARLLVHKLIPAVAPDMRGVEDVARTHFDYSALDRALQPTALRLNSTVVGVREVDEERVEVDLVRAGNAERITADHCILACYNGLVPHLCPQLPEAQKEALRYGVKVPFVYANVLLRNGRAYSKLGPTLFQCPHDPFQWVSAAPTTDVSGYEPPRGPDDPMLLFMMHSPLSMTKAPGPLSARDELRMGRHNIYRTPFATYEQQIREQLQSLLGAHGFDHEQDIQAITVNRIPHGYAYAYLSLYDPEWDEGQAPHEIGRAKFGRISIANSDSEARAYLDAAIDAAWRAVEEQTA